MSGSTIEVCLQTGEMIRQAGLANQSFIGEEKNHSRQVSVRKEKKKTVGFNGIKKKNTAGACTKEDLHNPFALCIMIFQRVLQSSQGCVRRAVTGGGVAQRMSVSTSVRVSRVSNYKKPESEPQQAASSAATTAAGGDRLVEEAAKAGRPIEVAGTQYFPGTDQFDQPLEDSEHAHNWSTSFFGLSTQPFSSEIANILMEPVKAEDIEIKPGKPDAASIILFVKHTLNSPHVCVLLIRMRMLQMALSTCPR